MDRITLPERPDWRQKAEELGFTFADMHGEPYWDETSAYAFTLPQIEDDIEAPATELHAMCREAVATALASDEWLTRLAIPQDQWEYIAASWRAGEPELYGRMDLSYDGRGPAKLLEYNADTPTSLYESSGFQWHWLEDQLAAGVLPEGADQFNAIHEALTERWLAMVAAGSDIHFAADPDSPEDYATVETLAWTANEAGMVPHFVPLAEIGLTEDDQFADEQSRVIGTLFKLYPWEDMLRDDFAPFLAGSGVQFVEPAWKAVVSNKGFLPLLWQMFPGHPNLLPAFFAGDVADALTGGAPAPRIAQAFAAAQDAFAAGYVTKPIFSREGADVTIHRAGDTALPALPGGYGHHPMIVQALAPLPVFNGWHPVLGAWIVGEACVGLGLREDRSPVTRDLSRFKPHFIRP
ncbi:MAG: glutathionylspermidine synthase family protein [Paracoccus sp. (in: a-proteobacteria)]|uniref:glutathionylspermidine synthase family protein n=1 Tax=Paracoccus sp. TaxID=267 RepID=UPI0026E089E1|nr:glutathionylspermidine synthase family protein [Paracoccus sp. (in: a-proteobacteria)]MDO5621366.1 glutathionylspermidine synthase family protein [Paracoccus sp. (in: a-proteobacteria)]